VFIQGKRLIKNKTKISFLKKLLKPMEFVEIVEPEKESPAVKSR
jgi:hypothetical protein